MYQTWLPAPALNYGGVWVCFAAGRGLHHTRNPAWLGQTCLLSLTLEGLLLLRTSGTQGVGSVRKIKRWQRTSHPEYFNTCGKTKAIPYLKNTAQRLTKEPIRLTECSFTVHTRHPVDNSPFLLLSQHALGKLSTSRQFTESIALRVPAANTL